MASREIAALGCDPDPLAELAAAALGETLLDERIRVRRRTRQRNGEFGQMFVLACRQSHTPTGQTPVPRGPNGQ